MKIIYEFIGDPSRKADSAPNEVQKKGKLARTELVEMVYEFIDDPFSGDNNALNEAQKAPKKGS